MQSVQENRTQAAPRTYRPSPVWVGWALAIFGLAIGIISGSTATRALPAKDWTGVVIGGLLALCGVLAVIAGIQRVIKASHLAAAGAASKSGVSEAGRALPRLGEILVYKYHLITEKDVQRALAKQRESSGRPLGEILVEMGRINWRDLAKALEDQLAYGDPWRRS